MLTLKDIRLGDCWRFTGPDAPDHRANFTTRMTDPAPKGLPKGWDDYGVDDPPNKQTYWRMHKDKAVELLEHYSTHPTPTPIKLTRRDLQPGDCFEYAEPVSEESGPRIVEGRDVSLAGMPGTWNLSTKTSARMDAPVRRIPRWDAPASPVLAFSKCRQYVVVAAKDVPTTAQRSPYSNNLAQAIKDEDDDIAHLKEHGSKISHSNGFCWIKHSDLETKSTTRVHATSKCGDYVLIDIRDVPEDAARSMVNGTVDEGVADQESDIKRVQRGDLHGPRRDREGFVWVSRGSVAPQEPFVRSCVDPLENLLETRVNGIDGHEALTRLEVAMRTESVVRRSDGWVSTNGEFGGLDELQFELARKCWAARLRKLRDDAATRERMRVTCEPNDG